MQALVSGVYVACAVLLPADAPTFMAKASVGDLMPTAVSPTLEDCLGLLREARIVIPKGYLDARRETRGKPHWTGPVPLPGGDTLSNVAVAIIEEPVP
jgi:hypothetical protein